MRLSDNDLLFFRSERDDSYGGDPWRGRLVEAVFLRRFVLTFGFRRSVR